MSDQCQHCTFRGNLTACLTTECSKHEDWITVTLRDQLAASRREIVEGWDALYAVHGPRLELRHNERIGDFIRRAAQGGPS